MPPPKSNYIDNWKTAMHTDTNSLSISTMDQDLTVGFDFLAKLGFVRLAKGSFKATIKKIGFNLDLGFTQ